MASAAAATKALEAPLVLHVDHRMTSAFDPIDEQPKGAPEHVDAVGVVIIEMLRGVCVWAAGVGCGATRAILLLLSRGKKGEKIGASSATYAVLKAGTVGGTGH